MAVEGDYDYFRNVSDLLAAAANSIFLRNMSIQRSELAAWGFRVCKAKQRSQDQHPFRRLDYLSACARPDVGNNNVTHLYRLRILSNLRRDLVGMRPAS